MLVLRFIEGKNKQFNKNRKYFVANSIYIENCQQNKKPNKNLTIFYKVVCVGNLHVYKYLNYIYFLYLPEYG